MSVTIQKETLAFYDYCLCVRPLKTEWRELSMQHFLALSVVAKFQQEPSLSCEGNKDPGQIWKADVLLCHHWAQIKSKVLFSFANTK